MRRSPSHSRSSAQDRLPERRRGVERSSRSFSREHRAPPFTVYFTLAVCSQHGAHRQVVRNACRQQWPISVLPHETWHDVKRRLLQQPLLSSVYGYREAPIVLYQGHVVHDHRKVAEVMPIDSSLVLLCCQRAHSTDLELLEPHRAPLSPSFRGDASSPLAQLHAGRRGRGQASPTDPRDARRRPTCSTTRQLGASSRPFDGHDGQLPSTDVFSDCAAQVVEVCVRLALCPYHERSLLDGLLKDKLWPSPDLRRFRATFVTEQWTLQLSVVDTWAEAKRQLSCDKFLAHLFTRDSPPALYYNSLRLLEYSFVSHWRAALTDGVHLTCCPAAEVRAASYASKTRPLVTRLPSSPLSHSARVRFVLCPAHCSCFRQKVDFQRHLQETEWAVHIAPTATVKFLKGELVQRIVVSELSQDESDWSAECALVYRGRRLQDATCIADCEREALLHLVCCDVAANLSEVRSVSSHRTESISLGLPAFRDGLVSFPNSASYVTQMYSDHLQPHLGNAYTVFRYHNSGLQFYIFPPSAALARDFWLACTVGLSEVCMEEPDGAVTQTAAEGAFKSYGRCELMAYFSTSPFHPGTTQTIEDHLWPLELLARIADYAVRCNKWIAEAHGFWYVSKPPSVYKSQLKHAILIRPCIEATTFATYLKHSRFPVRFYTVIPTTDPEMELKAKRGFVALEPLLRSGGISLS